MARINPGAMLLDGGDVVGPKKNAAAVKAAEEAQAKADAQAAAAQKALEDAKTKADALAAIKAADAAADAQAAAKAQADAAAKAEAAKTAGAKALADKAAADAKAAADKAASIAAVAAKALPVTKEMNIKDMTPAQIAEVTRAVVTAGGSSTDRKNQLLGETSAQANERIAAAYKELVSKPILTQEQIDGGMKVQWVREGAGGRGAYVAVKPIGYKGPTKITEFTPGVIPEGTKYTTGSAVGLDTGGRTVEEFRKILIGKKVAGNPLTAKEQQWLDANPEGVNKSVPTPTNTTRVAPKDLNSPEALEYNQYLKGRATAGGLTPAESEWTKTYNKNRYEILKGKATSGVKLTPEEQAESDFLISLGLSGSSIQSPTGKTETSRIDNGDGTFTVTYSDKSTAIIGTKKVITDDKPDVIVESDNPLIDPTKPAKTLISTGVDEATGDTIGYFADGSQEVLNKGTGPKQSEEFKDAYALLEKTFLDYGLESLVPAIKGYMERNIGPEQAKIELRAEDAYKKRFKGNELRLAAGKNALSENVYLLTEQAYDQTLKSYGQANYFGIDREAKQLKMAEIIGNDINSDEFRSRVDLAVSRVSNADPSIKKLLKDFYPTLTEADLVGYFLNPAENLPKLQERVTAAEIGSAFLGQGLDYTRQKSVELAQYGIDRAGALKGAAEVKEALPQSQKYADIYGESGIKYTQQTAEEEFLKNNQDAATKRKRLASMERGSFSGSTGVGQGAFRTTTTGQI